MKLSKNVNNQKCAPQMIFFDEICFRKIWILFDIENWLWKSDFCNCWQILLNCASGRPFFLSGHFLVLIIKDGPVYVCMYRHFSIYAVNMGTQKKNRGSKNRVNRGYLKYGFHKKYFRKSETLTSWTLFSPVFFQISADWWKIYFYKKIHYKICFPV